MSENLNRDFSVYASMETEELEEILRLDAEAPEGAPTDTELLLFILEVLASRENTENVTGNTAQKAWESFQQNYMPRGPQRSAEPKQSASWIRRLAAAAAVAVLLISIPVSSRALTLDEILDIFARWAKESFSFVSSGNAEVSEPSPEDQDDYASLQELLQEENCDTSIIPSRIPDGFNLHIIKKDISPTQEVYLCHYSNDDREFFIRIQNYLNEDFQIVEVEDDYSEIYSVSEIDYYLFENAGQHRAFWVIDTYECIISGDLSITEIKWMIDSIGKG